MDGSWRACKESGLRRSRRAECSMFSEDKGNKRILRSKGCGDEDQWSWKDGWRREKEAWHFQYNKAKHPNNYEEKGQPYEGSNNGTQWWSQERNPVGKQSNGLQRRGSGEPRSSPIYKTDGIRPNVPKRDNKKYLLRQQNATLEEECGVAGRTWEKSRLSSNDCAASVFQNAGSNENHRRHEPNESVAGENPESVSALCTGIVALCNYYYIRLKKERRLRELERRRRMLLFHRTRTQERLQFAVLCVARLMAGLNVSEAYGHIEEGESQDCRIWNKIHSSAIWETVIEKAFSNFDWTESFRMTKSTFYYLCDQLRPCFQRIDTNINRGIPVEVRLAITLWRLGSVCDYHTIESIFGFSQSTICTVVHDVCEAIVSTLTPKYVCVPHGDMLQDKMRSFEERYGLKQLAGVVGTFHVPIKAPNEGTGRYFNTKGWHSVVLQAVVDSDFCFWDLNIGCPGNLSDSQVLLTSELYEWAREGTLFPDKTKDVDGVAVPIHLLGPCSYPLLHWLMTPLTESPNPGQREMNQRFTSALGLTQVAFGRLKNRWPSLLKRSDTDLTVLPKLIAACCTLHNICEIRGDPFEEHWQEEAADEELEQPSESEEDEEGDERAEAIRTALLNIIQN